MSVDLRCASHLHARLDDGRIEIKCSRRDCGAKSGTVVMHYFDQATGEFIETKRFSDPARLFNGTRVISHPAQRSA